MFGPLRRLGEAFVEGARRNQPAAMDEAWWQQAQQPGYSGPGSWDGLRRKVQQVVAERGLEEDVATTRALVDGAERLLGPLLRR